MSILSDLLRDVASLLFPARCAVCGEPLARGERTVCTFCRATAPMTGYWNEADNPVARKCWGLVPVERASGFLFFVHGSGWRRLIHGFKYRGAWRTAREMGAWYGRHLRESGLYDDVEVVVPLPLCTLSGGAGGATTSRSTSPRESPRSWVSGLTAAASAAGAIRPARPSDPAATGPATSKAPLRSGIPSGSPGGMSCWSMT